MSSRRSNGGLLDAENGDWRKGSEVLAQTCLYALSGMPRNLAFSLFSAGRFPAILATLLLSHTAFACSVCFGDPNAPAAQGMNRGILLLFGVTAFTLSIIAVIVGRALLAPPTQDDDACS